jgi:hypothetical protein
MISPHFGGSEDPGSQERKPDKSFGGASPNLHRAPAQPRQRPCRGEVCPSTLMRPYMLDCANIIAQPVESQGNKKYFSITMQGNYAGFAESVVAIVDFFTRLCRHNINAEIRLLTHRNLPVAVGCRSSNRSLAVELRPSVRAPITDQNRCCSARPEFVRSRPAQRRRCQALRPDSRIFWIMPAKAWRADSRWEA